MRSTGLGRLALALGFAFAFGLGCASALETRSSPALLDHRSELARGPVLVRRFGLAAGVAASLAPGADPAGLVTHFVVEALRERGVAVIAPDEAAEALGTAAPTRVSALAAWAAQRLHATAILSGRVTRYRERAGQAAGSTAPASVAFEVELYAAPSAALLWQARFDETQRALLANVLNLGRYPGAGTRWLTAAELARWGAREVARAAPLGP